MTTSSVPTGSVWPTRLADTPTRCRGRHAPGRGTPSVDWWVDGTAVSASAAPRGAGHVAVRRAACLGLERRRHGVDGVALLRVPHAQRRRHTQRLARLPHLVRSGRPDQHRRPAAPSAPRGIGATRSARRRGVVVGAARRLRPRVGLDRVVRPHRGARAPHGLGGADVTDRRRRGAVHGRSLDTRDRRRDRRTPRRARRRQAAHLHGRIGPRHPQDLRADGRRRRPVVPVPGRVEGRRRPRPQRLHPGAARRLRCAREARPRRARRHDRVRPRARPAARRTRPTPPTAVGRAGRHPASAPR